VGRERLRSQHHTAIRNVGGAPGVPDDVGFATKPVLAAQMLTAALDAHVPASWVAVDEVYGATSVLPSRAARPRRRLRAGGGVRPAGGHWCWPCPSRRAGCESVATSLAAPQRRQGRHRPPRRRLGAGSRSTPQQPGDQGDRWLLRRHPRTGELASYLCWAPTQVPLHRLIRIAGARWAIEETFQAGKSQVRHLINTLIITPST
jgi:SRSO17 transposase